MKLSVSVPDELWEKARRRAGDDSPSAIIQSALSRLVSPSDAPYARRPPNAKELLTEAAKRLGAGASKEYERGYRDGLAALDEEFWLPLNDLAKDGFDLQAWAKEVKAGNKYYLFGAKDDPEPPWFDITAELLGELIDDHGGQDAPNMAYIHGLQAAWRDAWEAQHNAWETAQRPEASDAPGGNADAVDGEEVAAPAT